MTRAWSKAIRSSSSVEPIPVYIPAGLGAIGILLLILEPSAASDGSSRDFFRHFDEIDSVA
jgi:hypothetical protein